MKILTITPISTLVLSVLKITDKLPQEPGIGRLKK